MGNTRVTEEIWVTTPNKIGTLTKLTASLSEAKVNVWAISAWEEGGTAKFRFITDNNKKALELWRKEGFTTDTREVVVTELEDKPGTTWNIAQKISAAGINVHYMYVTTCGNCPTARAVLSCDEPKKVATLLG